MLSAIWKNKEATQNFSQYAATDGMIATTWFYVVREEWDVVEDIIKVFGEIFSKDFPDEK